MPPFTRKLLKWYRSRERVMPWRGERDPYKIWLSEIMLQQTQVETVIPYFHRWLKKFPSVKAVAQAAQDEILKAWEGLGYYARARNFHEACQKIMNDYSGEIPSNVDDFSKLKGVGPYTVAAVQSIAFQKPLPAIDGNVKRVVSRIQRIQKPSSKALLEIGAFLTRHISNKEPGDFNQAMMDLGATICLAKNPLCLICPVSMCCEAFQRGETARYPIKEKKPDRPHYKVAVGIVWKGDKILVSKRKSGGLLGGLWEFPGGKIKKNEDAKTCAVREIREEVGIEVQALSSIGVIRHAYTHFSIEMEGIICKYRGGEAKPLQCEQCRWISFDEISQYAFPKANHKLFPLMSPY